MTELEKEINRRRTFAIISHPDAGKTTLTEKLLLYGGAINQAGAVKGKKSDRHAVSDWMEIENKEVFPLHHPFYSSSIRTSASTFSILPDIRTSLRILTVLLWQQILP